MSLIAGIDLSTRELHAALIPLDGSHDAIYRSAPIACGRRRGDAPVDMRHVRSAVRDILSDYLDYDCPTWHAERLEITCVALEYPIGSRQRADAALYPVYGAVAASIPGHITFAAYAAQTWRRMLAIAAYQHDPAKPVPRHQMSKEHLPLILERYWTGPMPADADYADALGVALAFRNANEAAAA